MTGFEQRAFGIGSDHSTNWVTTTAHVLQFKIKFPGIGPSGQVVSMPEFILWQYEFESRSSLQFIYNFAFE